METMKLLVVLLLFECAGLSGPAKLRAQTFKGSPALDPNCYFPSTSNPSETQVRFGDTSKRYLGLGMLNIGAAPNEQQGRIYFSGLPANPPFIMNSVRTGPSFDINKPDVQAMMSMPYGPWETFPNIGASIQYSFWTTGHFHTHDRTDLLMREVGGGVGWRIYWADENGLYDSTRFGDIGTFFDSRFIPVRSSPYCAYLTSDSVEDIIFGGEGPSVPPSDTTTSFRVFLFQGGESLYAKGDTLTPDSSCIYWQGTSPDSGRYVLATEDWAAYPGDYRGTGRQDVILDAGNLMFYRNDPAFTLAKFAHALLYDTLAARWQAHKIDQSGPYIAIPAISQTNDDFLFNYIPTASGTFGISIFRGGPEFGSKRIFFDNPDYFLNDPGRYDSRIGGLWITQPGHRTGSFYDCGDMTGTGHRILRWEQNDDIGNYYQLFYTLYDGMSDKADMFVNGYLAFAEGDTLTANSDGREDVVLGMGGVDDTIAGQPQSGVGEIEIIYGTNKIPAPGESVRIPPKVLDHSLEINPNPLTSYTRVTWTPFEAGRVSLRLNDILGRTVLEQNLESSGQTESFTIHVPQLANGHYTLELLQDDRVQIAPVVIFR